MLLGSDRSARRSDLAEEEAARRDGDAGREHTPVVRSCAVPSNAPDCFCLFLRFASLLLVPLVSLAEDDDSPPPRPLDGRGELSIAYCLQHDKMRRFPTNSNARPLYYPDTAQMMTHHKLDGFKMLLNYMYRHHRLDSTLVLGSLWEKCEVGDDGDGADGRRADRFHYFSFEFPTLPESIT